jgi:AMP phosphorylase
LVLVLLFCTDLSQFREYYSGWLTMFLRVRPLEFEARRPTVILNSLDADSLGVKALDRVELSVSNRRVVALVNVAEHFMRQGEIGLYGGVEEKLGLKMGERVRVMPCPPPESLFAIKKKLSGNVLRAPEMKSIVEDVTENRLSDVEITAFVTALYNHGMIMSEVAALSSGMAAAGMSLRLSKKKIFDKHSIGGVAGDKTSMILVPIISSAGMTIPKTSSRAITSPAGTADRVECLCPVNLSLEDIRRVVEKTGGCLVWGGAVDLAPADDAFIRVEYPLSIDPLLLPSVMSKKKAAGADYVVIDIPTGKGVKFNTINEAQEIGRKFIDLGRKLGIRVEAVSTFGEQPIGHGIGPALEAREALRVIKNGGEQHDLINKVCHLAGVLFEFKGYKNGDDKALKILRSGKADKKLREIIKEQGGNPRIKPEDIPLGSQRVAIKSKVPGKVWWVNNRAIIQIARSAGAPNDKGAGVLLHKKLNSNVKIGDTLFEIFSEKSYKMNRALEKVKELNIMGIGEQYEMVLAEIPKEEEHKQYFVMER